MVHFGDALCTHTHREEKKKVGNMNSCYNVLWNYLKSQYFIGNRVLIFLASVEDAISTVLVSPQHFLFLYMQTVSYF